MPDAAADAAVAEAMGITDPAAEASDESTTENEAQEAEDVAFEQLPSSWQEEIRRLRRENAAARVARRTTAQKAQGNGGTSEASTQALTAAENRGRESARMEFGIRLAGAEVRAALAGALTDEQITDLVDDLNMSRFVLDDGEVDRDAIKVLRDKYASIIGKKPTPKVGHGQRGGSPSSKTNADLFGDWLGSTG